LFSFRIPYSRSALADRSEQRISAPSSRVDVLVIPTNEEWMLARHTVEIVG
jgi:acetate kinase